MEYNNNNKRHPVDDLFEELVSDLTNQLRKRPTLNLVSIAMSQKKSDSIFGHFRNYISFIAGIGAVLTTILKRNVVVTVDFEPSIAEDDMETINIKCGTTNVIPAKYNNSAVNTFIDKVKELRGNEAAIKALIDKINAKELEEEKKKDAKKFKQKLNKVETVEDLFKQFGNDINSDKGGNA